MNLLIISVIIFLLWFLFGRSKKKSSPVSIDNTGREKSSPENKQKIETIYQRAECQYNEYDEELGLYYREIEGPYFWERKTYIFGKMMGKYNGEYFPNRQDLPIYQVNIYEAEIYLNPVLECTCINSEKKTCNGLHLHQEGDFQINADKFTFDNTQLPTKYLLISQETGEKHLVELQNINFYNVVYLRKMHQIENKEIFGTINCDVNAYISEIIKDKKVVREYSQKPYSQDKIPNTIPNSASLENEIPENQKGPVFIPSIKTNYFPKANFRPDNAKPINSKNENTDNENDELENIKLNNGNNSNPAIQQPSSSSLKNPKQASNNFPSKKSISRENKKSEFGISWIIPLIFLGMFFLIIPGLSFIFPIICFIILFVIIPIKFWELIFKGFAILIGVFYAGGLVWFLITLITQSFQPIVNIPKILVSDNTIKELPKPKLEKIITDSGQDTIFRFSKNWKDYKGNNYSGKYFAYKSQYNASRSLKRNLSHSPNANNYNFVIHKLKEFDKEKLVGLYNMFDSIAVDKKLNKIQFADMVISFVQDYNYSLILPEECNPQLYSDNFIQSYLSKGNAVCVPNEPFGLMTPMEVLVTSNADCDSRTLLIYTILSKYGYDLIVLSSEIYGHSLIAINLPYNGRNYYLFENQKFALVETTVRSSPPAYISNEIANMNNWYISLKSK